MVESGQGQRQRSSSAAHLGLGFENFDFKSRLRQNDCRSESIGPGPDHIRGALHCLEVEIARLRRGQRRAGEAGGLDRGLGLGFVGAGIRVDRAALGKGGGGANGQHGGNRQDFSCHSSPPE